MAPRSRLLSSALVCMACIAGLAAALLWRHAAVPAATTAGAPQVALATGEYLAPSRTLADFSLIDHRGQPFGSAQLRGHWSFLFFGYTNCPDFCPSTLVTLAALDKRLTQVGALRPQVIFMSVDARRDTPAQLAKYVPYFDPDFIGITAADQPAIEQVARRLGVGVIITPTAEGGYSVDHSGAIYVVDPAGRLRAILNGPFSVAALEADFARITAGRA